MRGSALPRRGGIGVGCQGCRAAPPEMKGRACGHPSSLPPSFSIVSSFHSDSVLPRQISENLSVLSGGKTSRAINVL